MGDDFLEFVEEGVLVGAGVVAQRLDALDQNFVGVGAEELHRFGDEIGERHGVGIVLAVEKIGLDPGRDDFDEFDVGVFEFVAGGERVGMDGGFGGAVDGGGVHRSEAEAGRNGHHVGGGLFF